MDPSHTDVADFTLVRWTVKTTVKLKMSFLFIGLALFAAGCNRGAVHGGHLPEAVSAMNRGVSAMGQYDYDAAVKAFEEALRAQPGLPDAKINLAIARFNRARKEDRDLYRSVELLDDVLKTDPNNVRALYFKGIVLQHLGNTEDAVACFQKVLEQHPGDGAAWYLLGMCKQRLGWPCETELLQAVELRPHLGSAYYMLFQVLRAAGQTERAQPYLEKFKALRESPLNEIINLPQYNQMGELALALPLQHQNMPPISASTYSFKDGSVVFRTSGSLHRQTQPASFAGMVIFPGSTNSADPSRNLLLTAHGSQGAGNLVLLHGQPGGDTVDATVGSGLEQVKDPVTCSMGDVDNDGLPDLVVVSAEGTRLWMGKSAGNFADVSQSAGLGESATGARSILLLDADHDGDLDILVCNPGPQGNQLWNNNADGAFTNIATSAGIACPASGCILTLPGDLDGDRDTDLVILREGRPALIFLNDLLGSYREAETGGVDLRGELGGVLQDFTGDGQLDLLVLGGAPARLQFACGDGHARFHAVNGFAGVADAAASWGDLRGFRVADIDLDGDMDVLLFSTDIHLLLNDGSGQFLLQPQIHKQRVPDELLGAEIADFNGDYIPDLLCVEGSAESRLRLYPGSLSPPSTAFCLSITGIRGRDRRTRSPATPYGTLLTVRSGLRQHSLVFTGQAGGFTQSPLSVIVGLGGAKQADYVQLRWPDGVTQVETALLSGHHQTISELERKISSCPVLFAWNGTRFEFVTDFAGIGGLGYFIAPGQYAPPQVLEHLKLEPGQLVVRDNFYELRVTEPMEEAAYVDQLELIAVDHPAEWRVFPDERLAITGPQPTHDLLVIRERIFASRAFDRLGRDCTAELLKADRIYAYEPEFDRRFFGFCRPHTLELDFATQVASVDSGDRLFLFVNGFLEYPYSQTAYAASQAKVGWEPIRIDRLMPDGRWKTIVPDAGAFGGAARTMTVDVTGLLTGPECRLRLTSNLEIYYDQVFLARDVGKQSIKTHTLSLAAADLRRVGFPREYSPDGRLPIIYDYDIKDATAPFRVLRGAFTRYGTVLDLLSRFDDQYAIIGPGDEIAVKFDAARLSPPAPGVERSFVLVSHAYCKDMDFYTATPQTVEPLPFRSMTRYPYSSPEHYPDTPEIRRFRQSYQTRLVD